jgi:methionine sulfoxide reductase heme-binding subunit
MSLDTNRNSLHKFWIWAALAIPGIYILVRYLTDAISYGQVIHETGDWSVGFLFLALAVTPFCNLLPKAKWPRWFMFHRRAIGVASFGYAAFHTIVYLERKWGYGYILEEAQDPGLLTGWIAMAIFLILAITSNNQSVRALRKNWQHLHRTVYIATALTFAHWVITSIEPRAAYITLGALCLVEVLRFVRWKRSS